MEQERKAPTSNLKRRVKGTTDLFAKAVQAVIKFHMHPIEGRLAALLFVIIPERQAIKNYRQKKTEHGRTGQEENFPEKNRKTQKSLFVYPLLKMHFQITVLC